MRLFIVLVTLFASSILFGLSLQKRSLSGFSSEDSANSRGTADTVSKLESGPAFLGSKPTKGASSCNCTISQGSFSANMNSFMGSDDAITFYSYGNPDPANSNTGLEQSDAMMLLLYEDPSGNISLIILLDDGDDNTGGTETIALNCIPGSANVSFINDPNDDDVQQTGAQITGNFAWGQPFNDGVVIGGMGCGATFTIDAEYADGISSAGFVQGSEGAPITQFLPNTDPILISCGNSVCCAEEYDVQGGVVNPSCPTSTDGAIFASASGGIAPYQWDISGPDGFFATEFTSADNEQFTLSGLGAGTYQVTVTDSQGQL